MRDLHRVTEHPVLRTAGGIVDERLTIFVVSDAPRVGNIGLHHAFDFPRAWIETPDASVGHAFGTPGGFDLRVQETTFAHVNAGTVVDIKC